MNDSTPIDVARIARAPGMDREQVEEFEASLKKFCQRFGCELVEIMPEEIIYGREPERRLCGSATHTVTADHSCMNGGHHSAPANSTAPVMADCLENGIARLGTHNAKQSESASDALAGSNLITPRFSSPYKAGAGSV